MNVCKVTTRVGIVVLALVLSSCSKPKTANVSGVISASGSYPSMDGKFVAIVGASTQGFTTVEIHDAKTGNLKYSGVAGNSAMKFFMAWDNANRFWLDTEDSSRVILFSNGNFTPHEISADDLRQSGFPKPPLAFTQSK